MFKQIRYLIISLYTVFKHLFKESVTLEYPEHKKILGKYFRGKLYADKCKKCMTCIRVCPANAIRISKNSENKSFISFDLTKCIFCGNCSFYCPTQCIKMLGEYELATDNKDDLILYYF